MRSITFQATNHRLDAKWHLEYILTEGEEGAVITRIWRDDDATDYELSWKVVEDPRRIVTAIIIGPPNIDLPGVRHPEPGSREFPVTNPQHIFSYKSHE